MPIQPNEQDTKPGLNYNDAMQRQAQAAFNRLHDRIGVLAPGTTIKFFLQAAFWEDLLKILEYAVLK